jgi:hypothetical protein
MENKYRYSAFLNVLLFVFLSLVAKATTNTASYTGAWESASNWSLGHSPIATEDVVIPSGISMAVNAADSCLSLTINSTGSVTVNAYSSLSIAGNFSNAGTFNATYASTLSFTAASNSTITGSGSYSIAGTIIVDMGSATTILDVQSSGFISGINAGGNYYFNFICGTWKMDNTGTLNDCYNCYSTNSLVINYGVVIEADKGTMNLAKNGTSGNVLLEGKLFVNGGNVNVQTGQALNAGQDFHYAVNGGTPQLYIASGNLNIGGGFSYNSGSDYIDFEMSGGTIIVTANGYTYANSFILTDELGGITVMSGGTIIIQDACLSANPDLDMGGANVKATLYSVTGGTIQFGYTGTQSNSTFYGVNAEPSTNYPNLDFESGTAKNVSAWVGGNINFLSIYINPNMTFNASGFPVVTILSNNGVFAFSNDGTYTYAGNIFVFAGSVKQLITTTLGSFSFDNLTINNTSSKSLGVVQGPSCSVIVNQVLTLNNGAYYLNGNTLTIQDPTPAGIVGGGTNSYIVSENTSMNSILKWEGITQTPGSYIFPFGFNSGGTDYYLPFTFNITSPAVTLGDVSLATYHTSSNNTPFAPGVTQMYGAAGSCYANIDESVQAIVDRWWQITAPTSPTADITFTYAGPEAATMTGDPTCGSTLDAYHWNTSTPGWDQPVGNQATAVTSTGATGNVTASGISTFSPWVLGLFASPLPIKLVDFTAVYNNDENIVNLNWITASEKNNKSFTVERSIDGVTYTEIATVAGAGSSSETLNYASIDTKPVIGIDYYRLKQTDFDGNFTYSDVVPVTITAAQSTSVFPNPVRTSLGVNYNSSLAGVVVLKVLELSTGRQLNTYSFNAAKGNNTFSIDARDYADGLYMIQITCTDGSTYNDKFIKE